MAGKKYGIIVFAKTPESFAGLSAAEQAKPGKMLESTLKKFGSRVEIVRRYWTGTFTHEATDVFVMEGDSPEALHEFNEELNKNFAKLGGDPGRFGTTVHVTFGINPDADAPKRRGR